MGPTREYASHESGSATVAVRETQRCTMSLRRRSDTRTRLLYSRHRCAPKRSAPTTLHSHGTTNVSQPHRHHCIWCARARRVHRGSHRSGQSARCIPVALGERRGPGSLHRPREEQRLQGRLRRSRRRARWHRRAAPQRRRPRGREQPERSRRVDARRLLRGERPSDRPGHRARRAPRGEPLEHRGSIGQQRRQSRQRDPRRLAVEHAAHQRPDGVGGREARRRRRTVAILDTGIDYDAFDLNGLVDLSRSTSFVPSDDASPRRSSRRATRSPISMVTGPTSRRR